MLRTYLAMTTMALALAACGSSAPQLGPDGKPLPKVYNIRSSDTGEIDYRMLNSVNTLRQAAGLQLLQLNSQLTAAAATHARDISIQNRPWHFGSDGSSPVTRAQRAGYPGTLLGEVLSETYETEVETLAAWASEPTTRAVIMNPRARDMGFAWHQNSTGRIWWVLNTGG